MSNTIQPLDIYIGSAILGIFTGIGTIIGQWIWKTFVEPRINKIHKQIIRRKKK